MSKGIKKEEFEELGQDIDKSIHKLFEVLGLRASEASMIDNELDQIMLLACIDEEVILATEHLLKIRTDFKQKIIKELNGEVDDEEHNKSIR